MRTSSQGFRRKLSDLKRAFTLLELLVIIAIMGTMVTVGIVSVRSGQGAARVKGATRDIFAAIRQARSTALVTQQPAIITYSTDEVDGEVIAKVEITSAKLMTEGVDPAKVRTVTGHPLKAAVAAAAEAAKGDESEEGTKGDGNSLEEVLFAPIDANIVKGMRLKVIVGGGELEIAEEAHRPKISVFSNVDYLLGKFKEANKAAEAAKKADEKQPDAADKDAAKSEDQEPVSIVWETNGRVEPHQVWIYPDGKRPDQGLSIKIDRFGAAKVISGDGREED